ncbi:MAG: hypothetical protein ACXAB4_09605 [Candidatus Hodarchaeales archaeon]
MSSPEVRKTKPVRDVASKFLTAHGTVAHRISKIQGFELSVRDLATFLRALSKCLTCHSEGNILVTYVYTPSNLYRVLKTETIELGFQPLQIEEGCHFILEIHCNPCQKLSFHVISHTETLLEGLFEHLKQIVAHQGYDYSTTNASHSFFPP